MKIHIGKYEMERDFGLKLLSINLGVPEVRTEEIVIPGMNGKLDISEASTGYPVFDNAVHVLTFDVMDKSHANWMNVIGKIRGAIHGRKLPVIIGDEEYHYDARISVTTEKLNKAYSKVVIELDAYPYKISNKTSMDDWLWDPFNFETDVIRHTKDINVPAVINVIGDVMPAGCIFHCSNEMTLKYKDSTYILPKGDSEAPEMILDEGDNIFTFEGSGTVSIEYRWGRM